jgi:hypothetical protein
LPWFEFLARRLPFALLLLAAACGDLPQPYRGNPGGDAVRLALPPAYRISVVPPSDALLTDEATKDLAEAVAIALRDAEVPAVSAAPLPLDLRLTIVAQRPDSNRDSVVPRYTLVNADGRSLASNTGAPVALSAWASEAPAMFKRLGERDAPGIAKLLQGIEAARKQSHPESLSGKAAPRLRLMPVKGAPGDGNEALTARMQDFLTRRGLVPQNDADGADYGVEGRVHMVDVAGNQQRVEVLWIVTRRDGQELGQVLQMNEVPKGSLNRYWADVAYVVADEAAAGIRDVLRNAGAPPGPQEAAEPPPRGATSDAAPVLPAAAGPAGGLPVPTPGRGRVRP